MLVFQNFELETDSKAGDKDDISDSGLDSPGNSEDKKTNSTNS